MPFLLLMPSYNQARYIVEAVDSVLAQDDPDWELWIVDNSSDDTPQRMAAYTDPRIHFHHIPQRMDPGSCLNWMLERVQGRGRDFSYLHTDNNLRGDYVRKMRQAMASSPLALAYCDMRVIDNNGSPRRLFKRGTFDLARLLSADPLGVPFSATVELAQWVGGFSIKDLADDVRFCATAHGIADYRHISEPLIDYRVHGGSRTELSGGDRVLNALLASSAKVIRQLQASGSDPLPEMKDGMLREFSEFEQQLQDLWYRRMGRFLTPWWSGPPRLEHFFAAGCLRFLGVPCPQDHRSSRAWAARTLTTLYFRSQRRDLRRRLDRARSVLLAWASYRLSDQPPPIRVQVDANDFQSVWAAMELERRLGWQPFLVPGSRSAPARWPAAQDPMPLLQWKDGVGFNLAGH